MSEFIHPYIANRSLVSCDQNLFSIQGWKLKETSVDVLLLEIVLSCNSGVGDKSDLVVTLYGQHPGDIWSPGCTVQQQKLSTDGQSRHCFHLLWKYWFYYLTELVFVSFRVSNLTSWHSSYGLGSSFTLYYLFVISLTWLVNDLNFLFEQEIVTALEISLMCLFKKVCSHMEKGGLFYTTTK